MSYFKCSRIWESYCNKVSISDTNEIIYDLSIFKNVQYFHFHASFTVINHHNAFPTFVYLVYLDIQWTTEELFDCIYFPNLQYLKLSSAMISCEGIFPSHLKFAELNQCFFNNLSTLSHVKELIFYLCEGKGFDNIQVLSNVKKLVLHNINELEDVSSLRGIHDLTIANCRNVIDLSQLGRVHRLQVESCGVSSLDGLGQGNSQIVLSYLPKNIDFSPVRSIYKVTLKFCDNLVDGNAIAHVQHLTIVKCINFEDTSALGQVRSLYLVKFNKIKRLEGIENVSHVHLEECNHLEDIYCVGKQQTLIILKCEKLKQLIKENPKRYETIFHGIPFVKIIPFGFSWYSQNVLVANKPSIFDIQFDSDIKCLN